MRSRIDYDTNFCSAPSIGARYMIMPSLFSESSIPLRPTYLEAGWQKTLSICALRNFAKVGASNSAGSDLTLIKVLVTSSNT